MRSLAILVLILVAGLAAPTQQGSDAAMRAAMHKETVDGDLKGAIRQYNAIVSKFGKSDHSVAARALLRMGQCYEKLGEAEARQAYERVVREFGDQTDSAAAARLRLAALGGGIPAGPQAMRAVWTGPEADGAESSLSPDGRFFTYPDWDTGNLALHDLATGADRPLTGDGTWKRGESEFAEVSAISRDGKQVAYGWFRDKEKGYELRVLSLAGDSKPRRIHPAVYWVDPRDWSPDGKWIVAGLATKDVKQLALIDTQSGSVRVLKSWSGGDVLRPGAMSPDGKYVLYARSKQYNQPGKSYIVAVGTAEETPLLAEPSSSGSAVWTPDGSRILFVSDRGSSLGLWSVKVSEGKPQGEPEKVRGDFKDGACIAFARDGTLFYSVRTDESDVYVAGLDPASGTLTSEPKRVNQRGIGSSWGMVAWLPDGKSLSLWSRIGTTNPVHHLTVRTLASGDERVLWTTSGPPAMTAYAGWFPDGRIMSMQRDGQNEVYRRVDSATGKVEGSWTIPAKPRPRPGFAQVRMMAPDRMTIYERHQAEGPACPGVKCTSIIVARDLKTARDRELFRIDGMFRGAALSPDGTAIAFALFDSNGRRLMIAPLAGGPPRDVRVLPEDGPYFQAIAWTADGRHVLGFGSRGEDYEVWAIPVAGGEPRKSPVKFRCDGPAVSPDGTQVAFIGRKRGTEVWAMTGVFPQIKSR